MRSPSLRVVLLHLCSVFAALSLPAGDRPSAGAEGSSTATGASGCVDRPGAKGSHQRLDRRPCRGRIEGAPLLFASELARVLDDGDNMRVLPIVTRGPFDNVYDLLYLRGVDAAIVYGDVLDHFKNKPEFANAWRRINYLVSLFPSEVHVFVQARDQFAAGPRRQGGELQYAGTAAEFSGPIIFKQLGIEVKATFIPHNVAMEKMRQGTEVAATFWVSSKPLRAVPEGQVARRLQVSPRGVLPTSSNTTRRPISSTPTIPA